MPPMKFGEFMYRIRENLCATPAGCHLVALLDDLENHTPALTLIANASLKALDFGVNQATAEIVDPRPAQRPSTPEDNSRYRGRRRR